MNASNPWAPPPPPGVVGPPIEMGWRGRREYISPRFFGEVWSDRDALAQSALTGLMAHRDALEFTPQFLAEQAYRVADAMMAEREKRTR